MVVYKGDIVWYARKLLDSSRVTQLGWKPCIELHEGIAHAYQCFLEEEALGN